MYRTTTCVAALLSASALGACSESGSDRTLPFFEIAVAPLELEGITDAC